MAFIDVQVPYASGAMAGTVGGAPTGGGVAAGLSTPGTPPGQAGMGGSAAIHHWVIGFYAIIAFVLIGTGVIFNGKGR